MVQRHKKLGSRSSREEETRSFNGVWLLTMMPYASLGLLPFPLCFVESILPLVLRPTDAADLQWKCCMLPLPNPVTHSVVPPSGSDLCPLGTAPHPLSIQLQLFWASSFSRFSTIKFSHYISRLQVSTSLKLKFIIDRPHTTLFFFLCVYLSENRDALFLYLLIFSSSSGGQVERRSWFLL